MSKQFVEKETLEKTALNGIRPEFIDPYATLIRWPDVCAMTGLARVTIYKLMDRDPSFPRPVRLTEGEGRGGPVGFVLGEVQAWVKSRIKAREDKAKYHGNT